MRRGDLQDGELIVPEFPEFRKGPVSTGFIVAFTRFTDGASGAGTQVEKNAGLLSGGKGQFPAQGAAWIAAQLQRACKIP